MVYFEPSQSVQSGIVNCPTKSVLLLLAPTLILATAQRDTIRYQGKIPSDFSLIDAMKAIYGDFDLGPMVSHSALKSGVSEGSFFDKPEEIDVHPYVVASVKESGVTKVFLVTYAIPHSGEDFTCHACAPLIGVAAFFRTRAGWSVESLNEAVVVNGAWGHPADATIIRIGPDHAGIELRHSDMHFGESTVEVSILVKWKNAITEAFSAEVSDDNTGNCGAGMPPCYFRRGKIHYVKGADSEYDDIILTRSGTAPTSDSPPKIMKVNSIERWTFSDGKYVLQPQ